MLLDARGARPLAHRRRGVAYIAHRRGGKNDETPSEDLFCVVVDRTRKTRERNENVTRTPDILTDHRTSTRTPLAGKGGPFPPLPTHRTVAVL